MANKVFCCCIVWLLLGSQLTINAQWSYVGSRKFSANFSRYKMTANEWGTFIAGSNSVGITAFKFNTQLKKWDTLGTPAFTKAIVDEIALIKDTLFVCYQDIDTRKIGVSKFNGSNWVRVGNDFVSNNASDDDCGMTIINNEIYVAYQDRVNSVGKASVKKFVGENWVFVGNEKFTNGNAWDIFLTNVGNVPYLSFREFISNTNNKVSVMKLSGNTWVYEGNAGISVNTSSATSAYNELRYDEKQGKLYLAIHQNGGFPAYVSLFEFKAGSWQKLGDITTLNFDNFFANVLQGKLAIHEGNPVVFVKNSTLDIYAFKFQNNNWVSLNNNLPITDSGTNEYDVCDFKDSVYIVYSDENYKTEMDGRISVKKYFTNNILNTNSLLLMGNRNTNLLLNWEYKGIEIPQQFIIEASDNGNSYETIGSLAALNTTPHNYTYSISQSEKLHNYYYFRIKQINKTGNFLYSNALYLKPTNQLLYNIKTFPNPFVGSLQINLPYNSSKQATVYLSDVSGRILKTVSFNLLPGSNSLGINELNNLSSGTYFLTIKTGNENACFKLTKK